METPPLTRRKLTRKIKTAIGGRNTSAYAEKTCDKHKCKRVVWKHLRLRGENQNLLSAPPKLVETPPLTRRKLRQYTRPHLSRRNTSAYAEKTLRASPSALEIWKHLRLRGENQKQRPILDAALETPPLTRRKLVQRTINGKASRNTSAYAEKTKVNTRFLTTRWKHLRLRGENAKNDAWSANLVETPPLTRRKPIEVCAIEVCARNTSAYAEKTYLSKAYCPLF